MNDDIIQHRCRHLIPWFGKDLYWVREVNHGSEHMPPSKLDRVTPGDGWRKGNPCISQDLLCPGVSVAISAMIWRGANPWVVCVSMCLCVCLYVCLYVSLWVLVCLWLAMHVFMCLCVCLYVSACVFPCVCVSVSVVEGAVYVCVTVCLRMHLCVCLCPCTVVGASLGLTLRGRGLPVHVYNPVTRLDQWYPVELSLVVAVVHPTKHHHTALLLISVERSEEWSLEDSNNSTVWQLCLSTHQGPNKVPMYRCRNWV